MEPSVANFELSVESLRHFSRSQTETLNPELVHPLDVGPWALDVGLMDLEKLKKECDITTFRASGPGGQHKNVTDSAVRLRHRPTGIVVIGRRQRSQHRNLEDALRRLAERIEQKNQAAKRRKRVPTRKSRTVRERELANKRRRGRVKSLRGRVGEDA